MIQRCSRCLYDATIPNIVFDTDGVCNYCHMHDQLDQEYPTGAEGEKILQTIADQIKRDGRGKKYDVIVGISGGCDSSYMIYLAVQLGLRPLAVHFDNTWNSKQAVENIHNILKKLDIDLFTYVVDNQEYDDINRSFLKSGVLDWDSATDIGLASVLNMAAEKYKLKYIFEGHSFRTEGISPLGWLYMDGKYIESVQKKHGTVPLKTFPNMLLPQFIKWTVVLGIKKIRPLYYINYVKKDAMSLLTQEYGWKWYGGHHLENQVSSFGHTYFHPRRSKFDTRVLGYSAPIRSGQMTREEGLALIGKPPEYNPEMVQMVKRRLGFSDEEFEKLMNLPIKTYRDYDNYKKTFERMRWFWWLMYKLNRVPKSFYLKYTASEKK